MIDVINLRKSFGDLEILKGINITINKGDIVAVLGPSGSGKSTFLRCLNCMEDPTSGSIVFKGVDIADMKVDINVHRRHMGMVFQHFNLFNNRLIGAYDWYRKKTDGILLDLPVSGVIGIPVSVQNAGVMASWGHELQLTWRDKVNEFNYGVTLSFSDQMNEVLDLKGTGPHIYDRTVIAEGKPLNTLYGYKCLGFFTSEEEIQNSPKPEGYASQIKVGDLKYADLSGPNGVPDGKIDSYDKTDIGWSAPRYMFGLDFSGEYKGFDFRVFFQGVGKRDEFIYGGIVLNPTSKSLLEDRWNPERSVQENLAHAKLPRYVNGQQNNYEISDFYVKSAAYLRLKNLQLGYTLPKNWTRKICFEKVRFSISANNLFTLTSYPYVDPEGPSGGAYYPQLRSFTFGVELTIGKN